MLFGNDRPSGFSLFEMNSDICKMFLLILPIIWNTVSANDTVQVVSFTPKNTHQKENFLVLQTGSRGYKITGSMHLLTEIAFRAEISCRNIQVKNLCQNFWHPAKPFGGKCYFKALKSVPKRQNPVPLHLVKWRYRALKFSVHFSSF